MIIQQVYWMLQNVVQDEEGQDLAEYALILLLIAIAAIAAVTLLGTNIIAVFNNIAGQLGT